MSIAIPPTKGEFTVKTSIYFKSQGNILSEPSQELQIVENNWIEHLRKGVAEG